MSFSVPEKLEYDRKLFAGLTVRQGVGVALSILVATPLLMTDILPFKIRAVAFGIIVSLGSGVFIAGKERSIYKVLKYTSRWNEAGYLDENAKEVLDVKEIKENIVVRRDNTKLAILRAKPVNINVKGEEETKTILKNYKNFLQSLDYPIHIYVRTVDSLNQVDHYFEQMESFAQKNVSENSDLYNYLKSQRDFFKNYMDEHTVKDRLFYIVIKSDKEFEKAVKELDTRCNEIQEHLEKSSVEAEQLNENELWSMLASYFEQSVEIDEDYEFPFTILKNADIDKMELQNK